MAKKLEDRRDPIFVVVLKVSYYIKKRGWHENQSDGMRHKQKESTVYNRAWNQLEATRGGRGAPQRVLPRIPKASTSRFALPPAYATDDDNGLGPKDRDHERRMQWAARVCGWVEHMRFMLQRASDRHEK